MLASRRSSYVDRERERERDRESHIRSFQYKKFACINCNTCTIGVTNYDSGKERREDSIG